MIISISLPEGGKLQQHGNNALIIFDEKESSRDLWKAYLTTWLTEGMTAEEYDQNVSLDSGVIEITHKNKFLFRRFSRL